MNAAHATLHATGRPVGPWSGDDVSRLVVTNLAGLVMVLAGWYQSAGAGEMSTALTWLCVGLAGLIAAAVANGLWLLRGLRAIGVAGADVISPQRTAAPAIAPLPDGGVGFVSGQAMTRYHRPACALATGREVTVASRVAQEGGGLVPCEVCEP